MLPAALHFGKTPLGHGEGSGTISSGLEMNQMPGK